MSLYKFYYLFVCSLILLFNLNSVKAEGDKNQRQSEFVEENAECFKCHNHNSFDYYNEYAFKNTKKLMCESFKIDSIEFYQSNHWSFSCYDCHSYSDAHYPHPEEGRMEEAWNCIDCHGYDEEYALFHFEEIEEEFQQSVHYNANEENFTCWKCHDPHSYKISARTSQNIHHTIAYDNDICLGCHANFNRFQLLTNRESIDIIQHHEWLPNQALHFKNVRCIECHTQINDSILIAHLVLPKENAVHRCTECHSTNSRLLATLYKFQSKEKRSQLGFFNAVILSESFVIGANRNYVLNKVSIIIAISIVLIIALHTLLRIIIKKN